MIALYISPYLLLPLLQTYNNMSHFNYHQHRYNLAISDLHQLDIDAIINRILENQNDKINLSEKQFIDLINCCKNIIIEQPIVLDLDTPIKIVGDIHGHFTDLINIFKVSGYPSDTNYLFLGNYVDTGHMSLECIVLLICYKIKYPENIFLLRGNHEITSVNRIFGFYEECKRKVNLKIWQAFNSMFNYLPLAAVIEKKIFCVHAGIGPQLEHIDQINKIARPLEITTQSLVLDLLWADPEHSMSGYHENDRGVSHIFGMDAVVNFLKQNSFELIVRSHQLNQYGYEFYFNKLLISIFSIPNYLDKYANYGAIMAIDENFKFNFELIKPKSPKEKLEVKVIDK